LLHDTAILQLNGEKQQAFYNAENGGGNTAGFSAVNDGGFESTNIPEALARIPSAATAAEMVLSPRYWAISQSCSTIALLVTLWDIAGGIE
jgi:hypothetical protein